jgi:xanthine dehydrogenase accessory factor
VTDSAAIIARLSDPTLYPAVLATLVRVTGSSYRRAGARLLLDRHGGRIGSISGGCLEEDLVVRMQTLDTRRPLDLVTYDTTGENDLVWGVGLGCHGVVDVVLERFETRPGWVAPASTRLNARRPVELWIDRSGTRSPGNETSAAPAPDVFIDRIQPPLALVICGAGDDAQPLVRLAKTLGWVVTVVDPRPAHATPERFPDADRVLCFPPERVGPHVAWDERTAAVLMTHHYRFDRPLLATLLPLDLPYLGLLGPRLRAERLLADVREAGVEVSESALTRLHAPVGLDLGGDGPEAVALAILAEIQAAFAQRSARPLRHRQQAIHAP